MLLRNCILTLANVESVIVRHRYRTNSAVLGSFFSSSSTIDRWQMKFDALKSFVEEHGHANVNDRSLQAWLYAQRSKLTRGQTEQSCELNDWRRKQIESLGVPMKASTESWDDQFAKLQKYHELHGHINVGRAEDTKLYDWVQRQRKMYRQKVPGSIPEERIDRLRKLGFSFDHFQDVWRAKLDELKKYKEEHGDCMVPLEYPNNPSLGIWVDTQRQQFIIHEKGEGSQLTDERKQLLDDVGFVWKAHDAKWQVKFEELKDHVRVNGFGNYPSSDIDSWVLVDASETDVSKAPTRT